MAIISSSRLAEFQSTLPVRGATHASVMISGSMRISIHAPRAGSDEVISGKTPLGYHFNPRSPCGERQFQYYFAEIMRQFQSTLPVRGATVAMAVAMREACISIHAPRAGSDGKIRQNTGCILAK